jgi:stalled ribosome rescue protein Dom34
MSKQIGIWLDHKQATLVILEDDKEIIRHVESGAGSHIRYRGASHPKSMYSAQYQQGDDQLDNKFNEKLNKYYNKVIEQIRAADSVLIFGPGEAKRELQTRMVHEKVKTKIIGIETADKITERQIIAKVHKQIDCLSKKR